VHHSVVADPEKGADWVKGSKGIYWDKDAKSAATTKAGETYIGSKWSDIQAYQANNSTSPEPDGPKLSPGKSSTPEETVSLMKIQMAPEHLLQQCLDLKTVVLSDTLA